MPSGVREPRQAGGFGALLRGLRQQAGLTQERLAERAGLSMRTIAYLEGNRVGPRAATVGLLADALGLEGPARKQFAAVGLALDRGHGLDGAAAGSSTLVTPAQLPADVAGFTGRAEHLARLDALLTERDHHEEDGPTPAVVISAIGGTAGVGKTALAVHWAHRVADQFPDGQLYVNLHGWSSSPPAQPLQALAQLLRGLGVDPDKVPVELDEAAGLYRSLLAGRRVLLVLDNARDPEQIRPLLPGGPACLVLVTSRDRLAGLVASHGARRLTLDVLTAEEAANLLGEVVGRERLDAEPKAAAELAQVCGLLPLALRIAAANLACHPDWLIAGYLERLRGGDRLAELVVDGDPQAAVALAFDSSYATLDAEARRLFRLLGLVPGVDVTAPAAAALAGLPVGGAARLLERLATAHLVEPHGPARFGFHDLLRAYARRRAELEEPERERRQTVERLLGWYLHTVDAADRLLYPDILRLPMPAADPMPIVQLAGHVSAVAWLDAERANLVAAVEYAATHGPRPLAWLLADALRGYFLAHRQMLDWLAVARAALEAADAEGDPLAQAATHRSLGQVHHCLGSHAEATEHDARALALARQAGWVDGEAAALDSLGLVHSDLGQLHDAAGYHAQALALHRRTGNKPGQAVDLSNLARAQREMGQLEEAIDHLTQALVLDREIGSRGGQAASLDVLGETYRDLGRLDVARECLERSLTLAQEVGNSYVHATGLKDLAAVHRDTGRLNTALELAESALTEACELSDPRAEADALNTLGSVHLQLGHSGQAVDHQQQALELACRVSACYPQTEALLGLAAACRQQGRYAQALASAEQAHNLARQGGYRILEGHVRQILAAVHLDLDRDGEATGHARQALAIHRQTGHRLGQAHALVVLGHLRRRAGDPDGARGCWQQSLALFTEVGASDAEQVRALLDP